MKIRTKFALSLAAFAVACGGTTDPSDKNGNANGDPNNANAMTNGMTNGMPNGNTNGMPNGNTNGMPNGMTNGMTNGMPNGMTNMMTGPCEADANYFGQITSSSDQNAGGAPSTTAYATDAGLAGALAQFTVTEEDSENDMLQVVDIDIAGATVFATNFGDGGDANFWVQDSMAGMQVRLDFDDPDLVDVKVGDIINFKITSFSNFSGHPQIATVEGLTVESSGNEVFYQDRTGMALSVADYNTLVRIGGTIGAGTDCGGSSKCYPLMHGPEGAQEEVIYRTSSDFIEEGMCVQYMGPLSGFPGPNADSGNPPDWQLNVVNFSWSFGI